MAGTETVQGVQTVMHYQPDTTKPFARCSATDWTGVTLSQDIKHVTCLACLKALVNDTERRATHETAQAAIRNSREQRYAKGDPQPLEF
jgi:hypothetical protein